MHSKHNLALSVAVIMVFSLFIFIVKGDNGIGDLSIKRETHKSLLLKNNALHQKNLAMYRRIVRLQNDLEYIEKIARQDLGLIRQDEIIFKMTTNKTGQVED
jgi:cell division protein FtsB